MLFDAHNHAFRGLGGAPRRGIFANMRTAVDKVGRGKERQVNARFSAMVSHFLCEAEFCNPASGWEKGQIEKNVEDARHRLWRPMPSFPSLAALNDWLEMRCQERWAQTRHGSQLGSVSEAWAEEARHLTPPSRPFDGFIEYAKRVSPTCLVHLEQIDPRLGGSQDQSADPVPGALSGIAKPRGERIIAIRPTREHRRPNAPR